MASRPSPLMKRIWITSAIVFALPFLAGLLVIVAVNPNDYRPRIEQAMFQATGRKLSIDGDISIGFGFAPVIQIHNIRIANPPGFSRGDFATIGMIETDINLFSLLGGRREIGHLDFFDVDLRAETNPLGQVNTNFGTISGPQQASRPQTGPAPTGLETNAPAALATNHITALLQRFDLHEFGIFGGRFARRDDIAGATHVVETKALVIKLSGPDQPAKITADLLVDTKPLAFNGETGPIERLLGLSHDAHANWPVSLDVKTTSASLKLTGVINDPLALHGYHLSVDSTIDDLSEVGKMAGLNLPPVHALQASFEAIEKAGLPEVSSLLVRSTNSDLRAFVPALVLDRLLLSAPAMDQPMHGELQGTLGKKLLQADLNLGTPTALMQAVTAASGGTNAAGADQRFPFELVAQLLGGNIRLKGGLRHPSSLSGLDATIEGHIADVSALSLLTGQDMPPLSNVTISLHAIDHPNGLRSGVVLDQIVATSSVGDIGGTLDISLTPRRAFTGKLGSDHFDLDALQTAFAGVNTTEAAPIAASTPSAANLLLNPRMFRDTPIDFGPLSARDLDLEFLVRELRSGGVAYHDLTGHVLLDHGHLTLSPFTADLPDGKLALRLMIDSTALPPSIELAVQAPGISLKPLLAAFKQPDNVNGTADLALDLKAAGRSMRALAASLTGPIGFSMTRAEIDNRLLAGPFNAIVRGARLPPNLALGAGAGGRTAVKCLALRADADRGATTIANLVLQTATTDIQSQGTLNLGQEVLSLRVHPTLHTGSANIVVPLQATGTFVQPVISLDPNALLAGALRQSAQASANPVTAGRNLLAAVTGAQAKPAAPVSPPTEDPCVTAQAQAHAVQPVFP